MKFPVAPICAALVMVNFSDGVPPSWSGAVPPGDLAAVRPCAPLALIIARPVTP